MQQSLHKGDKPNYHQPIYKPRHNRDEYLFDPEVSRYLTVLAEHHVFPKPEEAKNNIALMTVQSILALAAQAEKDSVLFYDELANNVKFLKAKQIFTVLKGEEQKYLVKSGK